MKIAIVEDNEANYLTLKQHIDSFFKAHNLIGTIDYYPDGLALVNSFKNNYDNPSRER